MISAEKCHILQCHSPYQRWHTTTRLTAGDKPEDTSLPTPHQADPPFFHKYKPPTLTHFTQLTGCTQASKTFPPFLALPLNPGTHPALKNISGPRGCSRQDGVHGGHPAPGHGGSQQRGCQTWDQPPETSTIAFGSCRKQGSLRSQNAEPAWEKQRS